jgi:hypothetical protein
MARRTVPSPRGRMEAFALEVDDNTEYSAVDVCWPLSLLHPRPINLIIFKKKRSNM